VDGGKAARRFTGLIFQHIDIGHSSTKAAVPVESAAGSSAVNCQ
jgi:hypothetical protein